MVALLTWTIAVFLLGLTTLVTAVVCLCVKEKTQARAIDVLLIVATLSIGLMMCGNLIPKEWYAKEAKSATNATDAVQLDFHRQADMNSVGLRKADLSNRLPDVLKAMNVLDGYQTPYAARKNAQAILKDLVDKHPKDTGLMTRLAVLTHESHEGTDEIFQNYHKRKGEDNELIALLEKVYSKSKAPIDEGKAVTIIDENLPEGWFHDEALKSVLAESSPIRKSLDESREKALNSWIQRYSIFQILRVLFSVIGIFAIVKFFQNKPQSARQEIPSYGFRKAYGCLLAVFYAQGFVSFMIGIGIGLYAGITASLQNKPIEVNGNFASLISTCTAAATAISCLASVYFFVCRPGKMSLWNDFWLKSQRIQTGKLLTVVSLSFCAMILTNLTIRSIFLLLPAGRGTINDMHLQMIDAAMSGNILWVLAWSILFCGIAPLSEEMLFRGLLYPWLRHRWGIICAVIGSALVFAAFHMNLATFPQLFVMGVIFAVVYERTRSLPTVTLLHATWNLWVMLAVAYLAPC